MRNEENTTKKNSEKRTLIVRDNYKSMLSTEQGSVTYSDQELMSMLRKYFPSMPANKVSF